MTTNSNDILSMEDCVNYVRSNFKAMYPKTPRRCTFGNIPEDLHKKIMEFAEDHNMHIAQALASLWDFYGEYEAEFEKELGEKRKTLRRG